MGSMLAIHWAATTHGTWLHGDFRGSWREGRLIGPDPFVEAESCARMSAAAVKLDVAERAVVADVFGAIVRGRRHRVFAATIQASHVHLIFAPLGEDVGKVIARFKYRSAVAVLARRRELDVENAPTTKSVHPAGTAGLYSRPVSGRGTGAAVPRSLWTAGKFPVFIFNEHHLVNAIEYVRDHNRRGGLPADPFAWIDPLFVAGAVTGERMNAGSVVEVPRV